MDAFETVLDAKVSDAEGAVRQALGDAGFGVLTEIDVAATLQAKLGVERPDLKILGACNPSFAHRALEIEPSVALLLPCNVVLEDVGDGRTKVSIADPRVLLTTGGTSDDGLRALADEAASALERALEQLRR